MIFYKLNNDRYFLWERELRILNKFEYSDDLHILKLVFNCPGHECIKKIFIEHHQIQHPISQKRIRISIIADP